MVKQYDHGLILVSLLGAVAVIGMLFTIMSPGDLTGQALRLGSGSQTAGSVSFDDMDKFVIKLRASDGETFYLGIDRESFPDSVSFKYELGNARAVRRLPKTVDDIFEMEIAEIGFYNKFGNTYTFTEDENIWDDADIVHIYGQEEDGDDRIRITPTPVLNEELINSLRGDDVLTGSIGSLIVAIRTTDDEEVYVAINPDLVSDSVSFESSIRNSVTVQRAPEIIDDVFNKGVGIAEIGFYNKFGNSIPSDSLTPEPTIVAVWALEEDEDDRVRITVTPALNEDLQEILENYIGVPSITVPETDEEEEEPYVPTPCTEVWDNGKDYRVRGKTTGELKSNPGTVYSYADFCYETSADGSRHTVTSCSGSNCELRESWCSSDDYVEGEYVDCSTIVDVNGEFYTGCDNGRCID